MKMKREGGFTLIELLIVVMIIAILAAIALPNFLAAQTRAKVSRARADIRTVVTGLETYRVDWNKYPTYHYVNTRSFHIGGKVPSFGQPDPDWTGANPITTPVSYLSSFPEDPFKSGSGGARESREYLYCNWYYALEKAAVPALVPAFQKALTEYGSYRLHSRGPDGEGPDSGLPYDPTNGTVSAGDITYGPVGGYDKFVEF